MKCYCGGEMKKSYTLENKWLVYKCEKCGNERMIPMEDDHGNDRA